MRQHISGTRTLYCKNGIWYITRVKSRAGEVVYA
nr:MAG TPA: hypothetical protein [Ackermannviridae sp.]